MSFTKAKAKLIPANQAALESLLKTWHGAGDIRKHAATNLENECGSVDDKLEAYLEAVAKHSTQLNVASPKDEFKLVGKSFALGGYEATPFVGAIFGRAILLEDYARYLARALDAVGYHDTEEDIRAMLRRMDNEEKSKAPPFLKGYYEAIEKTPLGKGAIFATFVKPVTPDQRPWTLPVPTANNIRSSIALGEDLPNQDYILFAYRLPGKVIPRVPTTASPGWFYQRWFRPNKSAVTDFHGWTEPLSSGFTPQPEVVHEEISGATVLFPIHIAAA